MNPIKRFEKIKKEKGCTMTSWENAMGLVLRLLKNKQVVIAEKEEILVRIKREDIFKLQEHRLAIGDYRPYIQDQLKKAVE